MKTILLSTIVILISLSLKASDTTKLVAGKSVVMHEFFTVSPDNRTITLNDINRPAGDQYWDYTYTWGIQSDTARTKTFTKPGFYTVELHKKMKWPYYYDGAGYGQWDFHYYCVSHYADQTVKYNIVIVRKGILRQLKLTLYKIMK